MRKTIRPAAITFSTCHVGGDGIPEMPSVRAEKTLRALATPWLREVNSLLSQYQYTRGDILFTLNENNSNLSLPPVILATQVDHTAEPSETTNLMWKTGIVTQTWIVPATLDSDAAQLVQNINSVREQITDIIYAETRKNFVGNLQITIVTDPNTDYSLRSDWVEDVEPTPEEWEIAAGMA